MQDWLGKYRQGGLENLLGLKVSTGRPRKIPQWAETALLKRLQEKQGFESYGEICEWLEEKLGVIANYKTVHTKRVLSSKSIPKNSSPAEFRTIRRKSREF